MRAVPTARSTCGRSKRGYHVQVSKLSTGPRRYVPLHFILRLPGVSMHCCKLGEFHPGNSCFAWVSHCYINIASLFSVYYSNVIPEYHGDSELSFA